MMTISGNFSASFMHLVSRHRACERKKNKQGSLAILIDNGTLEDFRTAFRVFLFIKKMVSSYQDYQQSIENIRLTSDREMLKLNTSLEKKRKCKHLKKEISLSSQHTYAWRFNQRTN